MQERASLAGGWLRIESAPGKGTTVEVWIPRLPVPESEPHADARATPGPRDRLSRKPRIRVLVAEDAAAVRDALEALLRSERGLELAAAVGDAPSAIEAAIRERPDVALVDVRMPGGGLHAAREIRNCSPETKVIAFTAHHDRTTVLEMLEAGVVGYLLKDGSVGSIVEAIEQAAAGQSTFSAEVTGDIVETLVKQLAVQRKALEKKQRQEKRIRRALDSEGVLEMVFQPICTLRGKTVGVEALARFRAAPRRAPDRWFAEAEEVGLRSELELAAVKAALAGLPDLPPKIYLSLNVSPKTVLSAGLRKLVAALRAGTHRDRGDRARSDLRLQAAQRGGSTRCACWACALPSTTPAPGLRAFATSFVWHRTSSSSTAR